MTDHIEKDLEKWLWSHSFPEASACPQVHSGWLLIAAEWRQQKWKNHSKKELSLKMSLNIKKTCTMSLRSECQWKMSLVKLKVSWEQMKSRCQPVVSPWSENGIESKFVKYCQAMSKFLLNCHVQCLNGDVLTLQSCSLVALISTTVGGKGDVCNSCSKVNGNLDKFQRDWSTN